MRYVANNFTIDSIKDKTRPPVKSICELALKFLFFALAMYQDLIPHHGWLDKKAVVQLVNPVLDPGIEISRGPGHPDPKIGGGGGRGGLSPKRIFLALWASVWSKYRGGGGGAGAPAPGFATVIRLKGKFKKHYW